MRNDILNRKKEILKWIDEHQSKAFICEQLNCKPETLNSYLKKFNVEYGGNQGGLGIKFSPLKKSAIDYLNSGSVIKSHILKLKLIEDGIKEHKCERCKKTKWLNNPIPLELHHRDGNRFNNEISNLEILCPNCHALEPNNSGAARKKPPVLELVDMPNLEFGAK